MTYYSTDAVGNMGTATRTVVVVADTSLPFIALNGAHSMEHEAGKDFTDPSAVVTDADGNAVVQISDAGGIWLIKAIHIIPREPASGADWESFWASLTFRL